MSLRILHIADVHLDRPFVGLPPELAARRRSELRDALQHCLEAAREKGVDAVTIAGDLWEDENVTADTRASVAHMLERMELPVLVACGNHDPYLRGGNYARTEWPDNVHVFTDVAPSEYRLDGVSVWGASWTGGELSSEFLETFRVPSDGRTHLLLLHGTARHVLPFVDEDDVSGRFEPERVREAGFTLCLAGHVHAASAEEGVVYPGSPEPLAWDETGRHCYALVEVASGQVEVELVEVNRRWVGERTIAVSGAGSSAELEEMVGAALGTGDGSRNLRVELVGEVQPECDVDVARIEERFRDRFGALIVRDRTHPAYDLDALARQTTARGRFVQRVRERIERAADESERERLELALTAGLRALDGHREVV